MHIACVTSCTQVLCLPPPVITATRTWRDVLTHGSPSARRGHTAVKVCILSWQVGCRQLSHHGLGCCVGSAWDGRLDAPDGMAKTVDNGFKLRQGISIASQTILDYPLYNAVGWPPVHDRVWRHGHVPCAILLVWPFDHQQHQRQRHLGALLRFAAHIFHARTLVSHSTCQLVSLATESLCQMPPYSYFFHLLGSS